MVTSVQDEIDDIQDLLRPSFGRFAAAGSRNHDLSCVFRRFGVRSSGRTHPLYDMYLPSSSPQVVQIAASPPFVEQSHY